LVGRENDIGFLDDITEIVVTTLGWKGKNNYTVNTIINIDVVTALG